MQKYIAESKAPLLINSCEFDQAFPVEKQAIADELLGGGKFAPGYERTYWAGCTHGFAVRGDLVCGPLGKLVALVKCIAQSNPVVKAGKEGVFKATVEFYKKHL